ncbi:hypothetical protein [Azospirillum doebereinerae]
MRALRNECFDFEVYQFRRAPARGLPNSKFGLENPQGGKEENHRALRSLRGVSVRRFRRPIL